MTALLSIDQTLNVPANRVWRALTDKANLRKWLPFLTDFKPELGFETRFMLGKDDDHPYEHVFSVNEIMPEHKITYGWRYEGYPGGSQVIFELFPAGEKTQVCLTHTITVPFPPG